MAFALVFHKQNYRIWHIVISFAFFISRIIDTPFLTVWLFEQIFIIIGFVLLNSNNIISFITSLPVGSSLRHEKVGRLWLINDANMAILNTYVVVLYMVTNGPGGNHLYAFANGCATFWHYLPACVSLSRAILVVHFQSAAAAGLVVQASFVVQPTNIKSNRCDQFLLCQGFSTFLLTVKYHTCFALSAASSSACACSRVILPCIFGVASCTSLVDVDGPCVAVALDSLRASISSLAFSFASSIFLISAACFCCLAKAFSSANFFASKSRTFCCSYNNENSPTRIHEFHLGHVLSNQSEFLILRSRLFYTSRSQNYLPIETDDTASFLVLLFPPSPAPVLVILRFLSLAFPAQNPPVTSLVRVVHSIEQSVQTITVQTIEQHNIHTNTFFFLSSCNLFSFAWAAATSAFLAVSWASKASRFCAKTKQYKFCNR